MGKGEGTETIEKGGLIAREIIMGRGPTSPIPVDIRTAHPHKSPVDEEAVHTHGSPVNDETDHVYESTQIGDQIPQKNNGPIMRPWTL